MDRFPIKGRELEVLFAQEKRKTPVEMKTRIDPEDDGPGEVSERSSSFERHQQRQEESRKGPPLMDRGDMHSRR